MSIAFAQSLAELRAEVDIGREQNRILVETVGRMRADVDRLHTEIDVLRAAVATAAVSAAAPRKVKHGE